MYTNIRPTTIILILIIIFIKAHFHYTNVLVRKMSLSPRTKQYDLRQFDVNYLASKNRTNKTLAFSKNSSQCFLKDAQ